MAAKPKTSLGSALKRAEVEASAGPDAPVRDAPRKYPVPPSRLNTSLVGSHIDRRYGRALKVLAAEESSTVRSLLEEALEMLFAKKGVRLPHD